MSIPTMTASVWLQIKDLDPLPPGHEYEGCWRIRRVIKVLYVDGATWTLVAMHDDPVPPPPPPPDLQGRMDLDEWRNSIKGGTLDEERNRIMAPNESLWQVHHVVGDPGRAVPVELA